MTSNREVVKKKIILATISCIEKEGVESVTMRNVAKTAEVNIAAINYYFGSKEVLLKETFTKTLNHFFSDLEKITAQKDLNVYSMLKVFFIFILQGSMRYSNFMKSLLFDNLFTVQYNKEFILKFNLFIGKALDLIMQSLNSKNEKIARVSLMQMLLTVLTPGFTLSITKELFGIDLTEMEDQLFYIDYLLQHYITWVQKEDIEMEATTVESLLEQLFNSTDRVWED